MLNQLEANKDKVRVNGRPSGGGGGDTPLLSLKGYVPLNKLVFKDSRESQTASTISLFSVFNRVSFWTRSLAIKGQHLSYK